MSSECSIYLVLISKLLNNHSRLIHKHLLNFKSWHALNTFFYKSWHTLKTPGRWGDDDDAMARQCDDDGTMKQCSIKPSLSLLHRYQLFLQENGGSFSCYDLSIYH